LIFQPMDIDNISGLDISIRNKLEAFSE